MMAEELAEKISKYGYTEEMLLSVYMQGVLDTKKNEKNYNITTSYTLDIEEERGQFYVKDNKHHQNHLK